MAIVSSPGFAHVAHAIITMTHEIVHSSPAVVLDGLDRSFLNRTLRTTLILGSVLTAWLVQTLQMPLVGGFAAGVLFGVGGLAATMWAVDQAMRSQDSWRRSLPVMVMLGKVLALYLALRILVWRWEFSPVALGAGAGLVMAVIVLKVIGRMTLPAEAAGRN